MSSSKQCRREMSSIWLETLDKTIVRQYKIFGDTLQMDLNDFRNESWICINKAIPKMDPSKHLVGFLAKSIRYHFVTLVRRKHLEFGYIKDEIDHLVQDHTQYESERTIHLKRDIELLLSDEEREILEMIALNNRTKKDIARELHIGTETLNKRIESIKKALAPYVF